MRKYIIPTVASLLLAAGPVYALESETETEVEESVETDDGTVEREKSVETERETDADTETKSTAESHRQRVESPTGHTETEVHHETEKTVVD